jgi:hypothetical protein
MEAGAAKARQRFTVAPREIEVSFRMTAAQVAVMRVFYEETLGGGTLPFDWIHPRSVGSSSFRFVEAPRVSATSANLFSVTAKLEELQ